MKEQINWAVAGTGGITRAFTMGLKSAEGARLRAVSSRSKESAGAFAEKYGFERAYGDFDEMLGDKEVDAVYIGVPHVYHKELAIRALKAKKAVLCEKPATINEQELAAIIAVAKESGAFFMEAMWNRFTPPLKKAAEWLAKGIIGEVRAVQANFCFRLPSYDTERRLLNRNLGGGALLDAGVYPIALSSLAFGGRHPSKIISFMRLGATGVDEEVSALLSYSGERDGNNPCLAQISAALQTQMVNDAWIYGSEGRIHVPDFIFTHKTDLQIYNKYTYHFEGEYIGNGYNYEAAAVMEAIREGKTESPVMSWNESLSIVKTMDTIRRQNGLSYPGE